FYSSLCETKFSKIKYFAKKMLTIFRSTYICEQTFSLMKYRKSKYASRLTDGHLNAILRISTSKIKPAINKLVDAIQIQKSHSFLFIFFFKYYNIFYYIPR
ncbi:general transcription factor II-I repeat domain-containing protein 2A-like, partial [Aphis craccivora]